MTKYNYTPELKDIEATISSVKSSINKYLTPEIFDKCLGLIDLTTLNSTDTYTKVKGFVGKVNEFKSKFPNNSLPASICIYPNFSATVKETLTEKVNVTAVAAGFPTSQTYIEVKCLECKMAVEKGADEIDIVLALNSFLEGNFDYCSEEIAAIRKTIPNAHLKVILETGALKTPENIAKASFLAIEAGADFIKTSTGKIDVSATPEAAVVMCNCIKAYYEATGKKIGFKPAGGIATAEDAALYYGIVDTILGEEWLNPTLLRFGASRMANNLLSAIYGKEIKHY